MWLGCILRSRRDAADLSISIHKKSDAGTSIPDVEKATGFPVADGASRRYASAHVFPADFGR